MKDVRIVSKVAFPRPVEIVYRRLPNDVRRFSGILRQESRSRLVIQTGLTVSSPRRVGGRVIADAGFSAIWFIYRDRWYDIGKFYDGTNKLVGYYCDIVEPSRKLMLNRTRTMTLTDLFLDLWITPRGGYCVLDEDEFQNALKKGYIATMLAREARRHLTSLVRLVERKRFPPKHVREAKLLANDSGPRSLSLVRR
jgi:predicted RNA-binding protein associated with RNAse of E/G family